MQDYPYAEQASPHFMDRLDEDIRERVMRYRREQMSSDYSWNGYEDCPFWPEQLAREYNLIVDTGWYHKMYQMMVAIAGNAIKKEYPITAKEIEDLIRDFDKAHGHHYENRAIATEADRAIEYAYRKA